MTPSVNVVPILGVPETASCWPVDVFPLAAPKNWNDALCAGVAKAKVIAQVAARIRWNIGEQGYAKSTGLHAQPHSRWTLRFGGFLARLCLAA